MRALTGDLAHDDAGGYAMLRERFGDAESPVHCLPGNHDDPATVRAALERRPSCTTSPGATATG